MKSFKILSLLLVLALMLSVGAFAAPGPASGEASGASGEVKTVEEAYIDYIRAWLQNELLHNDQMTQEQIDNEYMPLIEAGDYDSFPACYIYNGWLETGTAMTFEEFAAQYQPASSEPSGEVNPAASQESLDAILPELYSFTDKVSDFIQSADVSEGLEMLSGLLGTFFSDDADGWEDPYGEDYDYSMEVPQSVIALSEEDEILLNGTLKDGTYINEYFGIKLSVPEGGSLVRDNDDVTESIEIIPLSRTYEEGWGGLHFTATIDGIDGFISVSISALNDDEIGLSEEELVKKNIDIMWEINALFGDDSGPEFGKAFLAGEEHPMSFEVTETNEGECLSADFYIPKGDFTYTIYMFAKGAKLEDLTAFFEKI